MRVTMRYLAVMTLLLSALVVVAPSEGVVTADGGTSCCLHIDLGGSASGGEGANVTAWVINVARGGPRPPASTTVSQCTRWKPAANISGDAKWVDVATFRVDPDGVVAELHFRDCGDPPIRQHMWIRHETPRSLADQAMSDLRSRLLAPPLPGLSPPDRSIVHLETWLAVTDPGTYSVTASVAGLSSTVSARVVATEWELGDGTGRTCPGTGTPWTPADGDRRAPCGHTYTQPAEPNAVRVRLVWSVTWQASNGVTGVFPDVRSVDAVLDHPVREIQSIGVAG